MEPAVARQQHNYYIDVERRQFVPRLRLQLQAERTELQGDGQDAVEIAIRVLDNGGNVAQDFNGELRVTTTRGRLSRPGGRVTAQGGQASIKLTSVPETVARVTVTVQDPSGRCISDFRASSSCKPKVYYEQRSLTMHQKELAKQAWSEANLDCGKDEKLDAFLHYFESAPGDCWPQVVNELREHYPELKERLVMPL